MLLLLNPSFENMVKKKKIDGKDIKVYESVDVFEESSAEKVKEKLDKESKFEEQLEKSVKLIKEKYDENKDAGRPGSPEENKEKLGMYWDIGDVILEFQRKQGFSLQKCSKCGYKNLETASKCKICKEQFANETKKKESYETSRKIIERIHNAEDIGLKKSSMENMRNFSLLFPKKDYDDTLSFSKYRELGYLVRYPDELWRELYEKMESGELTNHKKDIRPMRNSLVEEFESKYKV